MLKFKVKSVSDLFLGLRPFLSYSKTESSHFRSAFLQKPGLKENGFKKKKKPKTTKKKKKHQKENQLKRKEINRNKKILNRKKLMKIKANK